MPLLCHYYAITMRYCGYLMLRLGMTWNDYVATAAHSSTMAQASLVWLSSIGILEQCWKRQVTQFADLLYDAKISVTAFWILKVHKCLAHGWWWKWRKDFWPVLTKKMAPSNGCICDCHSCFRNRANWPILPKACIPQLDFETKARRQQPKTRVENRTIRLFQVCSKFNHDKKRHIPATKSYLGRS